jgi:hypothetical protein
LWIVFLLAGEIVQLFGRTMLSRDKRIRLSPPHAGNTRAGTVEPD